MPVISVLSGGRGTKPDLAPKDPFFASVVLLTHIDDDPALDVSNSSHTITTTGGSIQSSVAKFGARSFDAQNAAAGRLTMADHADWSFGSGEFTIEEWVRWKTAPSSIDALMSQRSGSQASWSLIWQTSTLKFQWSVNGVGISTISTDTFNPTLDQWYHIAVDRDSSDDIRIYIDGVVRAGPTNVTSTFFPSTSPATIGNTADDLSTWAINAYIDEVRWTKGVGRYGGAFTPPTVPFPDS